MIWFEVTVRLADCELVSERCRNLSRAMVVYDRFSGTVPSAEITLRRLEQRETVVTRFRLGKGTNDGNLG